MFEMLPIKCTRVTHYVSCYRCGTNNQNILHSLIDCLKGMHVWNTFDFSFHIDFYKDDMHNWMKRNVVGNHGHYFSYLLLDDMKIS